MATSEDRRTNESGIEIEPVYTAEDVAGLELEAPGEYPFTRGPYASMYRGRPWTIRQYAGFGSAEETNERFRYLLDRGQTGISIAFDLPTQLGYDSDDPLAAGEVGRTGVAIDSIEDMRVVLQGLPLDRVSTSMTINAPAALLLLLYELVAEEHGVPGTELRGTVQNDILKEYIARGNYIFPPRPSMRLTTDLFAYCSERLPRWNTISISGYHIREAGSTAVQEVAFTLANGIAYCRAAVDAGLSPDEFGERLSFFFNAHNDFFQEVAKYRAARRLWARIMKERLGATNPRAIALRFHAQTGGSTLTAQQPENNVVRVAIQALSAACGGAQSLHTNGFDEALALPTERAARIALRTQQVLQHEAGTTSTADPLGGSFYIEALDDRDRGAVARADRPDRGAGRRGHRRRAGLRPARDRRGGVPLLAADRVRGAGDRGRERVHGGGGRRDRAPADRRGGRAPPARADGPGAGRARRRRGRSGPRGRPGSGGGRREPARPDARGAPGEVHDRRDLRHAPRALGHI
jgi:methylmalonyl-CoA mutase N-terminal domain/subunit